LILPTEIVLDRVRESISGKGKIGSTGKGIGPAYADFVDRQGLMVNDLLNPDILAQKLRRHLEYKKLIFKNYDSELIKTIMNHEHLNSGIYYDSKDIFNFTEIYEMYLNYRDELKEFITDTDTFIKQNLGKKKILLEGAQGDMLSINHGTYPFVTSSDCTAAGLAQGVGLKESDIDLSLGIIKGFYMTRVGGGPFPTEIGGWESDKWCNGGQANRDIEKIFYTKSSAEDRKSEFHQGVALRMAGNEYGATTKRPRRTGWLDLPLLRYVLGFNSPDIILTKLDILNNYEEIKIAYAYQYKGSDCYFAGKLIKKGDILRVAIPDSSIMKDCQPVYQRFKGWKSSLKECKDYESLPLEFKNILSFIINEAGINPRIISIGPDREETIFI
jgi:adenylosuccinate synthase